MRTSRARRPGRASRPWRRWRDALGEGSHRGAAARDLHASALTDERGAPRAPPSRSPARAPREVRRCAASRVDANPRSAANARRRRTCPAPTPSQSWLPRPSKARPTSRTRGGPATPAEHARRGRRRAKRRGSGIIRQHDTAFRVVEERVNGAHAATFAFDDDDLLTQAGGLTITREPASGFVTQATAGLVTEAWTYSDYGEVETYTATVGGVVQIAWSYVRDDLGRIVEKTETTPEGTRVLVYEYDLAARLSAVYEDGLLAESYGYDDNGNRLSSLNADGVFDAAFDEQDRLLEYGDESFTWTDNGELLACTDTATGDTTTYAYDAVGNLRGVGLPSGDLVKYLVDGRGRRVGKKLNGVLERGWLWRGQLQPVAELDGAGNVVARLVYAGGVNVPALMVTESATSRLVTDHLGSMRRVIDVATGVVVQELEYDSWGRVLLDTNPGLQPFGFAGGLYDSDTGLVRFGSRDYDAETGRWTTKDPIRFGGGVNLFEYAQSSPIARKDPTGRDAGTLSSTWVEPTIQRCCGDSRFGGVASRTAGSVAATSVWGSLATAGATRRSSGTRTHTHRHTKILHAKRFRRSMTNASGQSFMRTPRRAGVPGYLSSTTARPMSIASSMNACQRTSSASRSATTIPSPVCRSEEKHGPRYITRSRRAGSSRRCGVGSDDRWSGAAKARSAVAAVGRNRMAADRPRGHGYLVH
ncbi:MAG: hypothetical protein IPG04_09250 [Polyangiaceae bacterium]|nr:hypothetical protein [Polyangiaceae bacterium]